MKTVVLVTNSYPFSKYGEYMFIEPELEILSKDFKIIIIPLTKEIKEQRGFVQKNQNIKVIDLELKLKTRKEIWKIWKYNKLFFRELKHIKNIVNLKKLLYHYFNMINLEEKIQDLIVNNIISKNSIFYTYWFTYATSALINLKQSHKIDHIVTRAHRGDLYIEKNNGYIPFRKNDIKYIDKIITISLQGYKYIIDKYNISHIENIYLGIKDCNVKNKLNRTNKIKIVSCSLLSPVKRVNLIMQYLSRYSKDNNIQVEWTHIGTGSLYQELLIMAKDLEHNYFKINFIGYLENEKIFQYYKNNSFDYFITLSSSEGLPVSLMEASSVGLALIATDVGGINEIVFDNINGFLLSANPTYSEFKVKFDQAIELKKNIDKFILVRNNSIKIYKKYFNNKTNYTKLKIFFKDL